MIFEKPLSLWYSIIPPYTETVQSAPDELGNIVFSAWIANSKISFSSVLLNKFEIDAAAATQHADDEPSPAPIGISESILILIPLLKLFFEINCFSIWKNGLNFFSIFFSSLSFCIDVCPNDYEIRILSVFVFSEITVAYLLMAPKIALFS